MKSPTPTLIKALRLLARDIQSEDQIANMAIAEAADRLEEQEKMVSELRAAGDYCIWNFCPKETSHLSFLQSDALKKWNKAKENAQ